MSYLPCVEIESQQQADSAVIWLHGLGADGHDFASLVPQLAFPKKASTRFIFPHAPSMPVTINGGYIMPAWYDILEMSIDRKVDVVQLEKSAAEVAKLILMVLVFALSLRGKNVNVILLLHHSISVPQPQCIRRKEVKIK